MRIKLFILLFAILLSTSCNQKGDSEFRAVTFYHYQLWVSELHRRDLKDSSVIYFDTVKTINGTDYNLRNAPQADSAIMLTYSIIHDSLFYQSTYCKLLDTIELEYKGRKISLNRSNFDEPNSADEESYIYWNNDFGIVGVYNWSMGPILLYDDSKAPNFAKEVLYDYIVDVEERSKK